MTKNKEIVRPQPELLELVKKDTIIEYWEQTGTKRRQAWLYYKHKEKPGKQRYFYSEVIEYKAGDDVQEEVDKRIVKIALELTRNLAVIVY